MPTDVMPTDDNVTTNNRLRPHSGMLWAGASISLIDALRRNAAFVVTACMAVAIAMNVCAPVWTAFTAEDSHTAPGQPVQPSKDSSVWQAGNSIIAYVVLDRGALPQERLNAYRNALAERLRNTVPAVLAVNDLASDSLTAPIALSDDADIELVEVRLAGASGSRTCIQAVTALRAAVRAVGPPTGLRAYVAGPGPEAADTISAVSGQTPWIAVILVAAIVVMLIVIVRDPIAVMTVFASTILASLIALPTGVLTGRSVGAPIAALATVALTSAAALQATQLLGNGFRRQLRAGHAPAAAQQAACRSTVPAISASAAVLLASLTSITVLDPDHLLSMTLSIAVGVMLSVLLCCACYPGWLERAGIRDPAALMPRTGRPTHRLTAAVYRHPAVAFLATTTLVAVGLLQAGHVTQLLAHPNPTPDTSEATMAKALVYKHFGDDRLLPSEVVVHADHDLRNPAGLLAIERVTRRLIELPTVTRVESAAWPAGEPWPQATIAYQIGEMNRQLQTKGLAVMTLTDAVHRLPNTIDDLTSAIDGFDADLDKGNAGLSPMSSSLNQLRSTLDRLQTTVSAVSSYADPIRHFVNANTNCASDLVCSSAQRMLQPLDEVVDDTSSLVASTRVLPATVSSAKQLLASASATLAHVRGTIGQTRALVVEFAKSAGTSVPEMTKASSLINTMTADLSNNGSGGFYLSQAKIDSADYESVRKRSFSADGQYTRIFIYSTRDRSYAPNFEQSVISAVSQSTKFGALTGSAITVDASGNGLHAMTAISGNHVAASLAILAAVLALIIGGALGGRAIGIVTAIGVIICATGSLGLSTLLTSVFGVERIGWGSPLLALVVAVPVAAEEALWLAMRWRARAIKSTLSATHYRRISAPKVAALLWASTLVGVPAVGGFGLGCCGLEALCIVILTCMWLRVCMIGAISVKDNRWALRAATLTNNRAGGLQSRDQRL